MERVIVPTIALVAALLLLSGALLAFSGPTLAAEQGEVQVVAGQSRGHSLTLARRLSRNGAGLPLPVCRSDRNACHDGTGQGRFAPCGK